MNSSTSRKADERQRREEIKKQIEELKGQLGHVGDNDDDEEAEEREKTLKRKMGKSKAGGDDDDGGERKGQRGALLLAPDTPSPSMFVFSSCFLEGKVSIFILVREETKGHHRTWIYYKSEEQQQEATWFCICVFFLYGHYYHSDIQQTCTFEAVI